MNKSDSIKQLAIALNKFQSEVSNPKKTETNPFHGSKYAPLGSVIDQVKPVLDKHGLCFSQLVSGDGAKSSVTTLLMHESGEFIESEPLTFPNQISKGDSAAQGGGSSITYARRYSLEAILGISSEEDNDGNPDNNKKGSNNSKGSNKKSGNKKIDKPGEVVIKFGKYKGKKLKNIPGEGLNEIYKDAKVDFYKKAIKAEIKRRNNGKPPKRQLSEREKKVAELVNGDKGYRKIVIDFLEYQFPEVKNTDKKASVNDLGDAEYKELIRTLQNTHEANVEPPDIEDDPLVEFEVPF
ncbi:ERF family protein [Halocella sp. SP3-1]|uniref:ERF family protein n=1 Tax=Halocella sp. SP3-1 TaxID=2382161 RepID=UPI000F75C611|nr:ERF family protein [Halocella sp. SP3-1]AZO95247.1 hypothetical protein D7D81_11970 [Halocella sp. SP3-1]